MKIVFTIPGLGFGGAERVISILANKMSEDHSVSIILTSGNKEAKYHISERVELIPLEQKGSTVKTWFNYRRICKELSPDVNIAFLSDVGAVATMFLIGTGIPVIISERNDPTGLDQSPSLPIRILQKIATHFCKGYVFQSEGAKSFYPKRAQRKSAIILNPLDTDKLPERELERVDSRIVTVGRLHPQKNHKMLISAFAKSEARHEHTLHIYGDGVLRDELSKFISSLDMGDRVFLAGNSKQVHEDIRNAKLFAFTSDYEGLPNALMEAMALGIPCISTDCSPGGARMLIEDKENGILIPCGDVDRLSRELDKIVNGEYDLSDIGKKARLLRERANIDNIVCEWLECINKFKGN